jgi:hypothetical protein
MPASCSTRWSRPCTNDGPHTEPAWCIIRTEVLNTSAFDTPSAWPKRVSSLPSAAVGDSYDNALAETINKLYKAEVIHRRGPWRSFEEVEFATLEWVHWFNNRRLLEPIGNIPPAEAEARYYAMLQEPAMGSVTQTKRPPANPARFSVPKIGLSLNGLQVNHRRLGNVIVRLSLYLRSVRAER